MNARPTALLLAAAVALGAGCSFKRGNVAALSQAEDRYYAALGETLNENRARLQAGLTEQLKAELSRQQKVLDWERDLARAEVLLQVDPDTRGNRELLLLAMADADLGSVGRVRALEQVDQARLSAILDLYDALVDAVDALARNNETITEYLTEKDAMFALRSLDVPSMVSAISALRASQRALQGAEALSAEQRLQEDERLAKNIERAREAVINALKKQ